MKKLLGGKVLALVLALSLILPLLPALPSFAMAKDVTSITLKKVDGIDYYDDSGYYRLGDLIPETYPDFEWNDNTYNLTVTEDGYKFTVKSGTFDDISIFSFHVDDEQVSVEVTGGENTKVTAKLTGDVVSFSLIPLKGDVVVSVSKAHFPVTLANELPQGVTCDLSKEAELGVPYTFTVTLRPDYNSTPTVEYNVGSSVSWINLPEDSADSNTYTYTIPATDVSGPISVKITNVGDPETYTVYFVEDPGFTIATTDATKNISYGTQFNFTVSVAEGYEGKPRVLANGVELSANPNGSYTITVNGDVRISVSDITRKVYTITVLPGDGFTVASDPITVSHGDTAYLSINIAEGFDTSKVTVTGNNGEWEQVTTGSSQSWKLENVSDNDTITVTVDRLYFELVDANPSDNADGNKGYTITFNGLNEDGKIEYGTPFTIVVEPTSGYKISSVYILMGSTSIHKDLQRVDPNANDYSCTTGITDESRVVVVAVPVTITVSEALYGTLTNEIITNVTGDYTKFEDGVWTLDLTKIPEPANRPGFTFKGWKLSDGATAEIGTEDITINIEATWAIGTGLFRLSAEDGGFSGGKIIFKTTANLAEGIDEFANADLANLKLVSYGIFYGNTAETFATTLTSTQREQLEAYVLSNTAEARNGKECTNDLNDYISDGGRVTYYRYNVAGDGVSFNLGTDTYTQTFTRQDGIDGYRSAVMWLEFSLDGETFYYLSDVVVHNATVQE